MAGLIHPYNGIICIDKPSGFTSFDVIAKLRGMLHMKKLGHSGTLDPLATGVLPVFAGNATRAIDLIVDRNNTKAYRAGFRLGYTSDTLDITGKTEATGRPLPDARALSGAAEGFVGEISQIPPMYSAVSVGGKRLYDLARKGISVDRPARTVHIFSLDIVSYDASSGEGVMDVTCSGGTYIRTLIDDIGSKLGCGGIMTALRRTCSSAFSLDDCYTLEQVQTACDEGTSGDMFLTIGQAFDYPCVHLDERCTRLFKNGVHLTMGQNGITADEFRDDDHLRVCGCDGELLAVGYTVDCGSGLKALRAEKKFYYN